MDYSRFQNLAKRQLQDKGTGCFLVTQGSMVYDVPSNSYIDTSKRQKGLCLVTSFEDRLVDNSVIKTGDVSILCTFDEIVDIKPSLTKLEVLNKEGSVIDTYQIINPSKISPNAQDVIIHKLHCRK